MKYKTLICSAIILLNSCGGYTQFLEDRKEVFRNRYQVTADALINGEAEGIVTDEEGRTIYSLARIDTSFTDELGRCKVKRKIWVACKDGVNVEFGSRNDTLSLDGQIVGFIESLDGLDSEPDGRVDYGERRHINSEGTKFLKKKHTSKIDLQRLMNENIAELVGLR